MPIRPPVKTIGKSTVVYGFGNLISKLAIFFLIPVYTRYLTVAEVGILALLEMVEMFLTTIVPMGINAALWRHLPESGDEDQQKRLIISAFMGTFILNMIILAITALGYRLFSPFLGLQETNSWLFLLVVLNVFLGIGFRFLLGLWQYEGKAVRFVILSLTQFLGVLLMTIFLVVYRDWGMLGAIAAKSFVFGSVFVVSSAVIVLSNLAKPSFRHYKKLVKFGAPLILLGIVTPVLTFSDRFFMRLFLTLNEIGVYSIAYKFGMLINMVLVIPLQRGWGPMMYRLGVRDESHEFHRDVLFYYTVIGAVVFLAISFLARWMVGVVATEEYLSGIAVIPIVTLAYFFNGLRQFFLAGAALKDKTPRLAYAAVIGIVLNLAFNYVLIIRFGMLGAAWATLLSYVALTSSVYVISQRIVRIDWKWTRLVKLTISMLGTYLLIHFLRVRMESWTNFWALVGIFIFVVLLWATRTIGSRELNGLKTLMGMVKVGKGDV